MLRARAAAERGHHPAERDGPRHPSRRRSQGRERTRPCAGNELRLRPRVRVGRAPMARRAHSLAMRSSRANRWRMSLRSHCREVSNRYPHVPRCARTRQTPRESGRDSCDYQGARQNGACIRRASRQPRASGGRDLQIATMLDAFPSDGPAIFGGDLNTTTVEPQKSRHPALRTARDASQLEALSPSARVRALARAARRGRLRVARRQCRGSRDLYFLSCRSALDASEARLDRATRSGTGGWIGDGDSRPAKLFLCARVGSRFHRGRCCDMTAVSLIAARRGRHRFLGRNWPARQSFTLDASTRVILFEDAT